ncbi:uncharacterized protein LOC114729469 [Neltuma alba]|uniref:uncharacterized protein LOC114729469 n=1 Tax=Neltuma alba TaxID=207710 RepID=UPI0010A3B0F4|nr:uncharacterized protein LOC114729469 [Prosopis alba]
MGVSHQIEFVLAVSQISSGDHSQNQHYRVTLNSYNYTTSSSCSEYNLKYSTPAWNFASEFTLAVVKTFIPSLVIPNDLVKKSDAYSRQAYKWSLNSNETVRGKHMEDQRPRSSPRKPSQEPSPAGPTPRRSKCRFAVDDSGDLIECSGKYCRSCTAGMIADCVALCCCPCAVLHCFALAFVKAPWMVGRRCLGLGKKKKTKRIEDDVVLERNHREANTRRGWGEEGMLEIVSGEVAFEAEKVWKEMYEIGHFGFFHRNSN